MSERQISEERTLQALEVQTLEKSFLIANFRDDKL